MQMRSWWWWAGLDVVLIVLTGGAAWPFLVGIPVLVAVVMLAHVVATVRRGPGVGPVPEVHHVSPDELPDEVAALLAPLRSSAAALGWSDTETFRHQTTDDVVCWGVAGPFADAPCSGLLGVVVTPNGAPEVVVEVTTLRADGSELATNAPDRHVEYGGDVDVVTIDGTVEDVLRVHLRRLRAAGPDLRRDDPVGPSVARSHQRLIDDLRRRGWIDPDGHYTRRGAYVAILRLVPPWSTLLRRRRRAAAARWLAAV